MTINNLKNLSRNNVNFLFDNLEYKLENQQNLYYDRDDNIIVLSDSNFTFKCLINNDNEIIIGTRSYKGNPIELINKINIYSKKFSEIIDEIEQLIIDKSEDLGL